MELNGSCALIVGDNAQGKTSILEAVCVLLRLGSPRAKRLQPLVKFEQDVFGIAGDFIVDGDERSLRVSYGRSTKSKVLMQVDGAVEWSGGLDGK